MQKKNILIVNCYIDEVRYPIRRNLKIVQTLAPHFLAGVFSSRLCEIKLYDEMRQGPLEDEQLYTFPDMIVLTGLNTAYDRMLHVTAYARTKNKKVIVVAGGPAIRSLAQHSKSYFDYCCTGDIEQMDDVIRDTFGSAYVSENYLEKGWVLPRYDLADWGKWIGYLETSRNCYFNCDFCSLTAENAVYQKYQLEHLRMQLEAQEKKKYMLIIDNNFASVDRQFLVDKMELLNEFREKGKFKKWAALVSSDFFYDDRNLELAQKTGCFALFNGIESFKKESLSNFGKYQNIRYPSVEIIKKCLSFGIYFLYGLMLDIVNRSVADLEDELDFIFNTPEITLPSYLSLPIPMLGTAYFYDCLNQKHILPNLKIRDMDSTTLTLKPHDPLPEVAQFARDIKVFSRYRKQAIKHLKNFHRIYKHNLTSKQMTIALYNTFLLCAPQSLTASSEIRKILSGNHRRYTRTYIGSTETLDSVYEPSFRVDTRYEHYFKPTMLTDDKGFLSEALYLDFFKNEQVSCTINF